MFLPCKRKTIMLANNNGGWGSIERTVIDTNSAIFDLLYSPALHSFCCPKILKTWVKRKWKKLIIRYSYCEIFC